MTPTDPTRPPPPASHRPVLLRFALFLASCFLGVGVTLPFLPPFLAGKGLGAEAVAQVLFAGSLVRFLVSPALGRLGDRLGDGRLVLIPCAALSALAAALFLPAQGFLAVLLVQVLFAAAMAPLSPVGEAMALAATRRAGVDYGPVRGTGSSGFIFGALGAGALASWAGYAAVPWLLAGCYLAATLAAWLLPRPDGRPGGAPAGLPAAVGRGGVRGLFALHLLRRPGFGRLVAISALIQGSHAAYYGFSSIHWARAGHSAETIGLLWGIGVGAEVALFFLARPLLGRLSPRGLMILAAAAGMVRWAGLSLTTTVAWLVPLQAMHALTFGVQYMGAMRWLSANPPPGEALAAQALHAALGTTGAQAVCMLAAGLIYAYGGGAAFLAMGLLCAAAVPVALAWKEGGRT